MLSLDQLTVNEYTPGVGLSAHIDTHSAFSGAIVSLSLGGGCVMEFRRPRSSGSSSSSATAAGGGNIEAGTCASSSGGKSDSVEHSSGVQEQQQSSTANGCTTVDVTGTGAAAAGEAAADCSDASGMQQVLVYLPPRALLVMGGECRYAW